MIYVLPTVLLLFSSAFILVWVNDRKRHYLVWCCLCYLGVGIAMLLQLVDIPADYDDNTLVTAPIYVAGVLAGIYGIMRRSNLSLPLSFHFLSFFVVVGATLYFLYVQPSLLARIYVLNFGIATLILFCAWRMRSLFKSSAIDRLLLWMLILVGLQFYPRILLTAHTLTGGEMGIDFVFTPFWQWTVFSTAVVCVIAGLVLFATASADRLNEVIHERDTDQLTDMLNRRGLEGYMQRLGEKGYRGWIAICDVDYFKTINDTYGHMVGDSVLKEFSVLFQARLKTDQVAARIGGEEFVLFLGNMTAADAFLFLENIRADVRNHGFLHLGEAGEITCSFGCAHFHDGDFWGAIDRADDLLYAAKNSGRDRTTVEGMALQSS